LKLKEKNELHTNYEKKKIEHKLEFYKKRKYKKNTHYLKIHKI